jgi:glutamate/tyrosine decarboxylase-like PLP-dependent enzyme
VQILGIGTKALQPLSTDADGRVTRHVLSVALRQSDALTIVILDAGDLSLGAIDRFDELVPMARAAGAWVHVDGAFGLWARASQRYGGMLNGVETANSWATDAHKWLNTPKDIGIAIVSDPVAHTAAMGISAAYLPSADGKRNQIDWTPDWTRRARGFPVYAALRELGRNGLANLIDRCCEQAYTLAAAIAALDGAELVALPTLNQGLVRFVDRRLNATEEDHDRETARTIAAINAEGMAFFSGTIWKSRYVMRISVVNWRTTKADVQVALTSVQQVLAARASTNNWPE